MPRWCRHARDGGPYSTSFVDDELLHYGTVAFLASLAAVRPYGGLIRRRIFDAGAIPLLRAVLDDRDPIGSADDEALPHLGLERRKQAARVLYALLVEDDEAKARLGTLMGRTTLPPQEYGHTDHSEGLVLLQCIHFGVWRHPEDVELVAWLQVVAAAICVEAFHKLPELIVPATVAYKNMRDAVRDANVPASISRFEAFEVENPSFAESCVDFQLGGKPVIGVPGRLREG